MPVYKLYSFRGGLSDYEDKGLPGSFKFGSGLDIRKEVDSLSCQQALTDEASILQSISASQSPSSSYSPSPSASPSISPSVSPSASASPSQAGSSSKSPSSSRSPSSSLSPSASVSPSYSTSSSPSPSAGLHTVFSDLILWFVKASDGNIYGFGNTGKVYKRIPDGAWFQVYDAGQRITGAAEWYSSSGKTYLYFATRTNLHRKELPGRSDWNDVNKDSGWPKTNLTDNDWHSMREAGGALMIANAGFDAMVGYDDSYTNEAVDFIPGNVAKTIVERNGRTITGTGRANNPLQGINAAIDAEVPLAQIGNDGGLYFANMVDQVPLKRFPGGGKVNPGAVASEVDQANFFEWEQTALSWIDKQSICNMSYWGVDTADSGKVGVYTYGRKNKNHPMVLNLEYLLNVDEIGAIMVNGDVTLISYRSGSSFGVKKVDPTTKAQGVYEGLDLKAPDKSTIAITPWTKVELYMKPLPSGCSVEFWYKIDKTGSFIQANCADGNTNFATALGKKAEFIVQSAGEIFEPRIVLNPSGNETPEIYRIRIYFS